MAKLAGTLLTLMIFFSLAFTGLAVAASEIDTSVSISVPSSTGTGKTIDIMIAVQPAPQTSESQFDKVTLAITSPNGVTDRLYAMPLGNGTYFWSLMINHLGNYTFQATYLGEYSADGTIHYTQSQSATVTMAAVGDPLPPVEADGGSWATAQPMGEARGGLGVVSLNGKIYAIGGYTAKDYYYNLNPTDGFLATNEEYDPATDTWATKAPMPTARANFAIAAVGGKIYCINSALAGFQLDEIYHLFKSPIYAGINEVYDPATDTWQTKSPMPVPLSHAKANVVGGKIYIMDGVNNWMYDPEVDNWTKMAPAPFPVSDYTYIIPSAVAKGKIYFMPNYGYLLTYDAATNSWSQGSRTPRLDVSGVAASTSGVKTPQRIYLFTVAPYGWVPYGKTDISGPARRTTFVYDPQAGNWSAGTRTQTYRVGFGVATLNDKVYVVGGFTFDILASNNVSASALTEVYTPIGFNTVTPTPFPSVTENTDNNSTATNQPQLFPTQTLAAFLLVSAAIITVALVIWRKKMLYAARR